MPVVGRWGELILDAMGWGSGRIKGPKNLDSPDYDAIRVPSWLPAIQGSKGPRLGLEIVHVELGMHALGSL